MSNMVIDNRVWNTRAVLAQEEACSTTSGAICPGDGVGACKKCPHPILKVLNDKDAMELVGLRATVAQQAQMIKWLQEAERGEPVTPYGWHVEWADSGDNYLFTKAEKRIGILRLDSDVRVIPLYVSPPATVVVVYPSVDAVMKLVLDYQLNVRTNVTGTTNWAANLGMYIIGKIKELNQ